MEKFQRLLGSHMSIADGVDKAIERGLSIDCSAIQIFVKNNNQWFNKPLDEEERQRFIKLRKESGLFVFAHTGYLINLAATNPDNLEKSLKSLRQELDLAETLGLPFTALHPGSHLGQGEEAGIKLVAKNLKRLLDETRGYKVKVLLETTAGQGTNLGYKFEQLAEILELAGEPARTGVCFDTCHAFAAGYDLRTESGYRATWEKFNQTIGLANLIAFHLNDSQGDLGSKKDRHEHIGQGKLGLEAFRLIMNDARFAHLPMVLETPKDPDLKQDVENLRVLRALEANFLNGLKVSKTQRSYLV
jgi:deoxyribonuclease IV